MLIIPEDPRDPTSSASLIVANAGDSRSVLSQGAKAVALSHDHKPNRPIERQRIQKAGSFINAEGRVDGNLNLSRAIGDLNYKRNGRLSLKEQAITAFPDIKVQKLNSKCNFVIMGCDGIWESHTN